MPGAITPLGKRWKTLLQNWKKVSMSLAFSIGLAAIAALEQALVKINELKAVTEQQLVSQSA